MTAVLDVLVLIIPWYGVYNMMYNIISNHQRYIREALLCISLTAHGHHHHTAPALATCGDDAEWPFRNGNISLRTGEGGANLISAEPFKVGWLVILGVGRVEDGAVDDCKEE